ncbi:hypothetical protein Tco_1322590, partial [Tanacetum coccineum]
MKAHLAPKQISSSCEICSGPYDTQYCMKNLEQDFVDYASARTDKAIGLVSSFMASQDARLSKFEADFKQQQGEMTYKIDTVLKAITDRIMGALPNDTCSTRIHSSINAITICPNQLNKHHDDKSKGEELEERSNPENLDTTDHPMKEELRSKGIKSPLKLLSLKYLSRSSLTKQNRNPTSPKRIHFINSIIILNKYNEAEGEGSMKPSATECKDHEITVKAEEEVEEESEEEFKEETEDKTKEEEEDDAKYFDTFPTMEELGYHEFNIFDTTLLMTTLADKSLLSSGDNKPPMLEKYLHDSWKSRMELYMMNRPHGRMILASVEK